MSDSRPEPRDASLQQLSGSGGWWLLVLALGLGCMRFLRLGDWSLWYDEAITWADANHAALDGRLYNPLGYLAIRWVVEAFGVADEYALRFLPAVLGWLVIPLTYWAFAPFAGARRAGLAALLVAASSWQLYWSQNARFYTMAEVATLLGAGLCMRGFFRRAPWLAPVGGLLIAAGVLFHLQCALVFGALTLAPFALSLFRVPLEKPGRRGAILLGLLALVMGLAALTWVLDVWQTYRASKSVDSSAQAVVGSLGHFALATGSYLTPLLGTGFLIGAVGAFRERDRFHLLITLTVVLAVAAALVAAALARVTAQYVFVLQPFIALVAAWPVSFAFERRTRVLSYGYAALLVLPAVANSALYFAVREGERPRWREAYHYAWSQRESGDLVVGMMASVGEFYLSPGATDLRHPRVIAWFDTHHAREMLRWREEERRVWIVLRPDVLDEFSPADRASTRAFLREDCRLMRRFPVSVEGRALDVEVYLHDGS